jgi:5-methylcytosine-specific restriction endonuclease McrA
MKHAKRLPKNVERKVRQRASGRCEYCRFPVKLDPAPSTVDHIIARVHGGLDDFENLALACFYCNCHKGPNLSGIDPRTDRLTRLFHPRKDRWETHFCWRGAVLVGITAIGRTTVRVLAMNVPHRVLAREALIAEGVF